MVNDINIFINKTKRSQSTRLASGVSAKIKKLVKGEIAEALIIAVVNSWDVIQ